MYRQVLLFILLTAFLVSCGNNSNTTPDPEITNIQPASGPPGSMVTISGSGFAPQASGNDVSFNGTGGQVTSAGESELQATVPKGAETGPISITVGQATATGPNFTVEKSAPSISSIQPKSGPVGTQVTITGMNFSATISENTITFNGLDATVKSATETELITNVPQGATDGPVKVTVKQKTAIGANFTVKAEAPGISSVEPQSGTIGTEVTIKGMNFSVMASENTITFNNTNATVKSASETELVTEVPQGATDGPIEVRVGNKAATGPDFKVEAHAPTISSISPESGPTGTEVTISGSNFSSTASENMITFNDTQASINSASETELVAIVPDGATDGPVKVKVGQKTATGPSFTVEARVPGVSSVEPKSATVGSEVTIKGINFSTIASENTITFNGLDATVKSATETELVTEVPQGATDGPIEVIVGQKSATGPGFDVVTEGAAEFLFSRSGPDQDPDIYLNFDGKQTPISSTTAKATRGSLEQGDYQAELTDIAGNCSLSGQNPRTVTIVADDTTSVGFQITCEQATQTAPQGIVAFRQFFNDTSYEIFTMYADGSNKQQLTDGGRLSESSFSPAISPDGSQIVFIRDNDNADGYSEIWVMNIDGTNAARLTTTATNHDNILPEWSPDGSQIVYLSDRDNDTDARNDDFDMYIMDTNGSGRKRITNDDYDNLSPDWSPGGNKIAFTSTRDNNNFHELYVINTDGSGLTKLLDDKVNGVGYDIREPDWSPDGSQILFSARDTQTGNKNLYTINGDGSNLQQIPTDLVTAPINPNWSPDGNYIAYQAESTVRNFDEIWIIKKEGTDNMILTDEALKSSRPSWGVKQ